MAWRCSGPTNDGLIENLWRHGLIKSAAVKRAFLRVDRAHYAPSSPYEDRPQYIGHNATVSAPHMHASALENLLPFILPPSGAPSSSSSSGQPGGSAAVPGPRRILDIGCGSGYLTHVIAELLAESFPDAPPPSSSSSSSSPSSPSSASPSTGKSNSNDRSGTSTTTTTSSGPLVVGLDHIPALVRLSESNMRKSAGGRALLDRGRVRFVVGDGRKGLSLRSLSQLNSPGQQQKESASEPATATATAAEGGEAQGSEEVWDAIHVGASASEIHPALVAQLRRPGRMFVPVDDDATGRSQHIWQVDKHADGRVERTRLFAVKYVPLTDAPRE